MTPHLQSLDQVYRFLASRQTALVSLLIAKGVITTQEYENLARLSEAVLEERSDNFLDKYGEHS